MGKREEAVTLLRGGLTPGQIRQRQNVTLETILGYLDQMVGAGAIRRSDILFSIPATTRHSVFAAANESGKDLISLYSQLRQVGIDSDDIDVVLRYKDERYALGDMYEDVRSIEIGLHLLIRRCLEDEYGMGDQGWWRNGVPLPTRQKCVSRREEDEDPIADAYGYTDLVDLRAILDKEWTVISKRLPGKAASDRKKLSNSIVRLNQIRKLVMHPVRGGCPSEDDFDFLRLLKNDLGFSINT